jgi:hypothetical protein
MSGETLRDALLWCTVINYGVLLVWFLVFIQAHDWMYRLQSRLFHLSVEQFDTVHYGGMAVFKIGIMLFNLAPYIALTIVS